MIDNIQNQIGRAVQRVKIALMGRISSVIRRSNEVYVRFSDEDELRDIKIISPYGIYSLPTNNKIGQVIFNNSTKKASLVGIEAGDGAPVQIDIGETLVYNENAKSYILLKNNGSIEIKASSVSVNSGSFTHNGKTVRTE